MTRRSKPVPERLSNPRDTSAPRHWLPAAAASVVGLLKQTAREYVEDDVARLGASLSYYTVFSMAPILIIAIALASLVFGADAARGEVEAQLTSLMGADGASVIQTAISADSRQGGTMATVVGVITLLIGATGAFAELQYALNKVWDANPPERVGWWAVLRGRLLSFALVLVIGLLLTISLVSSAAVSGLGRWLESLLAIPETALKAVDFGLSFVMIAVLFGTIYKVLPDVNVRWGDVALGAVVTALLFTVGKLAIGLYLGNSSVSSTYGAAGSLAVLLVWVYYSAQILLIGAEFTQVYARRHGSWVTTDSPPGEDRS